MKPYMIGIDGGGTKTVAVLFDESGQEIKRVSGGFANFSVDSQKSETHLLDVLAKLTKDVAVTKLKHLVIGIAGYSNYPDKDNLKNKLEKMYPIPLTLVTDAEIALYSVKRASKQPVIMVLGGTGSVVMIEEAGTIRFIGGFGHLLGDEGSGYHLAITALKKIIDQYEEGQEITALTKAILQKIKAKNYLDIKHFVYNHNKDEIAKLSLFIAGHALAGDLEARQLFVREGELLAKQTLKAYQSLKRQTTVTIGIKGGFLLNAPLVKQSLIEALNQTEIKYILDGSPLDPVYGTYYLVKNHLETR